MHVYSIGKENFFPRTSTRHTLLERSQLRELKYVIFTGAGVRRRIYSFLIGDLRYSPLDERKACVCKQGMKTFFPTHFHEPYSVGMISRLVELEIVNLTEWNLKKRIYDFWNGDFRYGSLDKCKACVFRGKEKTNRKKIFNFYVIKEIFSRAKFE